MKLYRNAGVLDLETVTAKKVLFLGTGSLGSLTVANLAYPWHEIVLVDPDTLEKENVERHLLGQKYIGQRKVDGIAEWLVDKGIEQERIICHATEAEEVLVKHTDADLAVVSIDQEHTLHDIDAWCADNSIPALYGGIYPRGTGGEVIVILDRAESCYRCAAHMMGREEYKGVTVNYGLGTAVEVGKTQQEVPALHWAASSTAADMADIALEILSGDNPEQQILVRTHNSWEAVLDMEPGSEPKCVTGYIASQSDMGLIPNMKLEKTGNVCQLKAKRAVFSLSLHRWDDCPNHSVVVTIEDI